MLERILDPRNLNTAFKRVRENSGSGGVDWMISPICASGDYVDIE